jgi:hypothetical protein
VRYGVIRSNDDDWKQRGAMAIPFLACMVAAASFYHLPPRVLPSIQVVEGGRPGVISQNTDGSADLGVMQVNTIWVPQFASITGMTEDAVRTRLVVDPCFNIAAAGDHAGVSERSRGRFASRRWLLPLAYAGTRQ